MRVFMTGASGWIGSAVVDDLLTAGHEVVGLARSERSARSLERKGAGVLRGDLDDLGALRRGAAEADGVIHLANKHDWSDPAGSDRAERASVDTLARELAGSDRPFVVASVLSGLFRGLPSWRRTSRPPWGPARTGAAARTSRWTTCTGACARSWAASRRACTVRATGASSSS